jgi:RimJ/RimL family protein N-acetyltransferase
VSLTTEPIPTLGGEHVLLRPWSPADEAYVRAAHSDPEIRRWSPHPLSPDDAPMVVERRLHPLAADPPAWVIVDLRSGDAVGDVSFRWIYPWLNIAAVGYVVLAAARGRGVATESVRLASSHVLRTLGWPRLELHHAVANPASCRVAERCGFALEGTMRRALRYADGTWADQHLHARLAADPPPATDG